MEITLKGSLAEIKKEMAEFLGGAATPERKSAPSEDEKKTEPTSGLSEETPAPKIDYPARTKAETQALLKQIISSPEGRKNVVALLARFDVSKFTQLPEEHYGEFYAGLEGVMK